MPCWTMSDAGENPFELPEPSQLPQRPRPRIGLALPVAALILPFLAGSVGLFITIERKLGPGQWVSNIFNDVMKSATQAGILVLVWVNGIMYLMRQFLGGAAHRVSPVALIASTAVAAAAGLFLFAMARTPLTAFAAAALFAAGVAFWWPTMLGITSERFPRGGALLLAIIGATGSISTAIAGPVMGWINDHYGANRVLSMWAALPAVLVAIFTAIYLMDRLRGGYRVERIASKTAT